MGQGNMGLRDIVDIAVATIVILGAIIGAYVLILWAIDVRGDRKHSVFVDSPTPIFAGNGQGCDTHQPITVEQPGVTLRIRRIRYWADCATVDVKLPGRGSGHIILGVGNVSVRPPLGFVP